MRDRGARDGFAALTFYGDGSFPLYVREDGQGRAVAATFVADTLDPLFYPGQRELMEQRRELAMAQALANDVARGAQGGKKGSGGGRAPRKAKRAARPRIGRAS